MPAVPGRWGSSADRNWTRTQLPAPRSGGGRSSPAMQTGTPSSATESRSRCCRSTAGPAKPFISAGRRGSLGRFPGLANPRDPLNISRFARNPRIARVCADLRIGQELGEGIRRMFDEMRRLGLTDPVYRQTAGSVRLVLADLPRLEPALAARLPVGSQQVLDTLRAAPVPLGTGELAEALDLSRPTVVRKLRALEKAGLVRWIGKSQKDPRAAWI